MVFCAFNWLDFQLVLLYHIIKSAVASSNELATALFILDRGNDTPISVWLLWYYVNKNDSAI